MTIRSNNSKRGRAADALNAVGVIPASKRQRGSKAAVHGQRTLTMAGSINTSTPFQLPPAVIPVPTAEAASETVTKVQEETAALIANTKADASRLNTVAADLSACMTQHGMLLATVDKAASQPEDPLQRQKLIKELTTEFATANRPLLELNIYQRELSATLNFSGQHDPRTISANKLHVIPLAMELQFMRAANTANGERACRSGDKCDTRRIATRLGKKPWTMQEFLMPPDQAQLATSNELPIQAQLCLMCMKKNVYMHYAQSLYQDTDAKVVIQPYQSICGVEGGFDESVILKPPTDRFFGIVAPFVRHDVTMYTMELDPVTGLPFAAFTDAVYFRLPPVEHVVQLGQLFKAGIDGKLHDLRAVIEHVTNNRIHARITLQNRAWCICQRGTVCSCSPAGENPQDIVYDATRYALARLMAICQHYMGTGREAYIARLCMVAYLPLTRLFDAHSPAELRQMHAPDGSIMLDIDRCAKLVDIDEVLCFNTMPNMCDMMWANDYWYETKQFQENTLRHAYHHMFCKALPQRCKFRSMLPICVEYGVQHGQFADFMYAVVRCSLMGLSETASAPCSFESLRRIDAIFAPAENLDSGRRCEFVCRFSHVMFHAVKEYVCTTVRHISGLSDMLDLTYRWWIFESRIHDTMKQIRMQISDEFNSVVHGAPILEPAMQLPSEFPKLGIDVMANVKTDSDMNDLILQGYIGDAYSSRPLEFWSRANKSMIVKTGGGQLISCGLTTDGSIHTSFEAAMGPVEDTACRLNGAQEKNMFQMCREPAHVIIRLALQLRIKPTAPLEVRIPLYEPFDMHTAEERMHKYYGVSPETAKCVVLGLHEYRATGYVCATLFDTLNSPSLSQEDADALSVYCDDIDISSLFHFIPLPEELRQEQLQALRRKYCIQEEDSDETELGNLAEVYFCLTCMSTKAFVVESPEDGLIACGSVGIPHVVYNNSTKHLECRQCTDKSKMFRFSLAGVMARIGKRLHIICTGCASICLMDINSYAGDKYICATCVQNAINKRQREFVQTDVCALDHCKTRLPRDASCHNMLVIDDSKNNEQHIVGYCHAHRMMAAMVHRTTTVLSEINTAVVELIKEKIAPRRGAMKKTDATRFAIAAHRHVAYSLFGGRR